MKRPRRNHGATFEGPRGVGGGQRRPGPGRINGAVSGPSHADHRMEAATAGPGRGRVWRAETVVGGPRSQDAAPEDRTTGAGERVFRRGVQQGGTFISTNNSGRIVGLTDARPIACSGNTRPHSLLLRKPNRQALLMNWQRLSKHTEPPLFSYSLTLCACLSIRLSFIMMLNKDN